MRSLRFFVFVLVASLIAVPAVRASPDPSSTLRVVPVGSVETGDPIVTQNPASLMIYSHGHEPIIKIWLILVTIQDTYDHLISIEADTTIFSQSDFAKVVEARIPPVPAGTSGSSSTLTLPDAELMLSEFTKQWGPGTLTGKVDAAGPGVQFDFTGLTSAETGVGDNFAVNALAGGAYKDYGYGFAGSYDFSSYQQYRLVIENAGTGSVDVCLFINTGWTNDWSGGLWTGPDGFGASLARDTCWQGDYVSIGPSESKAVSLDFSSATCYNAGDDPVAAWQHPDGTFGVPVRRLDEVSNIGFHVRGDGAGSIITRATQYPGCQFDDQYPVGAIRDKLGTTGDIYYAYKEFSISTVTPIPQTFNVEVTITSGQMKVLVVANGYWLQGDTDNSGKLNEKTPWSGSTIIVPELLPIIMALAPCSALGLYTIRRRKKN